MMQQQAGDTLLPRLVAGLGRPSGHGGAVEEPDFAGIFEVLPSPFMVLDADLRYVAVNRAYEEATLRSRQELLGRGLFEMFPNEGESGRRLRASFDSVFATGEPDTIAFIPYEIPRPEWQGGGMEQRYWSATHTPLKAADGSVRFVVQNTVDVTEIVRIKEAQSLPFRNVPGELALLKHAQDVEEAYQETVSEGEAFRRLFRQAPGMIAVLEGPEHVFTFVNDSYQRFVGGRDLVGRTVREALPEIADQGFLELLDAVYTRGETVSGEAMPITIQPHPDMAAVEAFIDFTYNPISNAEGAITGVFVQGSDRTEAVRASQHQRTLMDELNHRVKNTLATIQAMARQSFRDVGDLDEARYAFESRLLALSRAHNILAERRWESAPLTALLKEELGSFAEQRVRLDGPEILLSAKSAIALAIVLHELTSNARRYGALAGEAGVLAVQWSGEAQTSGQTLEVDWQEARGTDAPGAPVHLEPGYGVRVITRIIEGEFGGTLALDLRETGLICRFKIKLFEAGDIAV
ncbi:sensor histidine kinase [Jiella sp. M17.18]|uniref:sensor histidine kinase n=1 Tax=Jiella sp. M17.18 TaxID=3234247 RepID=UPI0034DEC948